MDKALAERMYDAYQKNLSDEAGTNVESWDELPDEEKAAWEVAADVAYVAYNAGTS